MKYFKYFSIYLIIATLLIIGVSFIPHSIIEKNIKKSIIYVYEEGESPIIFDIPFFKIDTFTDMVMLNIAYFSDENHPIDSGIINSLYYDKDKGYFESSYQVIHNANIEKENLVEYSTYWHGIQIFLKPLMIIMQYKWLIIANYIILSFLCLYCLYLVYIHCSLQISVCLCISLLLIGFPIVPLCIQFSVCFYIMFIFICLLLKYNYVHNNPTLSFFTVGAFTSFFDLLTTPQITLGIPLIIYILYYIEDHRLIIIIKLSLFWIMGYAIFWLSKCFIGWLLTGFNIFEVFYESALVRSIYGLNFFHIFFSIPLFIVSLFLLFVVFIYIYKWLNNHSNFCNNYAWLIITFLIVPVWHIFMMQHTIIHYWFTWRALLVSVFSLLLLTIRKNQIL